MTFIMCIYYQIDQRRIGWKEYKVGEGQANVVPNLWYCFMFVMLQNVSHRGGFGELDRGRLEIPSRWRWCAIYNRAYSYLHELLTKEKNGGTWRYCDDGNKSLFVEAMHRMWAENQRHVLRMSGQRWRIKWW